MSIGLRLELRVLLLGNQGHKRATSYEGWVRWVPAVAPALGNGHPGGCGEEPRRVCGQRGVRRNRSWAHTTDPHFSLLAVFRDTEWWQEVIL
jgi:hypothetical protein